jgi:hypothetical protein
MHLPLFSPLPFGERGRGPHPNPLPKGEREKIVTSGTRSRTTPGACRRRRTGASLAGWPTTTQRRCSIFPTTLPPAAEPSERTPHSPGKIDDRRPGMKQGCRQSAVPSRGQRPLARASRPTDCGRQIVRCFQLFSSTSISTAIWAPRPVRSQRHPAAFGSRPWRPIV